MTELEAHPAAPPASAGFPTFGLAAWSIIIPVLGVAALALGKPAGITMAVALAIILAGVVMAAVYHAEVLAHYLGEGLPEKEAMKAVAKDRNISRRDVYNAVKR